MEHTGSRESEGIAARLLLLVVAAAATLALSGPARALTTDSYDGVAFYPFTVDPGSDACVPWTEPGVGATRNCDPINVVFPNQSLASVVARLHAAGWANDAIATVVLSAPPPVVPRVTPAHRRKRKHKHH